jgi:hypothetical protein
VLGETTYLTMRKGESYQEEDAKCSFISDQMRHSL